MSTFTTPIINFKPVNPTSESFLNIQKFGLQPYDRTPNDYLRFVAKIFTAWRDPNDTILNFDPFDDKYGVNTDGTGTTTTLQATSDKSIIAYIDGFQANYNFVRLTTDAASTDLTQTSVSNPSSTGSSGLDSFTSSTGEIITIDKSKYGEYHRFQIQPGVCFIDNQLIQITEETTWWFRIPEVKDPTASSPTFEAGQFIVDPLKVYSLLPNKNYKIILSYEYIAQFDSNSAQLRFETDETAIDQPYLLIGTFSTNEYGLVHQTLPINESSIETFKYYVIKEDIDPLTGLTRNYYYLKDINPQYLDKKYMSNHKNLFKHLQTQLLSILSDSKISNTFHCREMNKSNENIHPSCSSGDMVYFDGTSKTWYPAEVSRQDFDKVSGLYLKKGSEGTDFLFTSGIIEIDDTYVIMDSENMVLRNLIPGAEYFLAEDTGTSLNTAPFIDAMKITDQRTNTGNKVFTITTEVIAKANSIKITMKPSPDSGLANFSITRTFDLDPNIGEQRIAQSIFWDFTDVEMAKLPSGINFESTNLIKTDKLQFTVELNMVKSSIQETREEIIEQFKLDSSGDVQIETTINSGTPSEEQIVINIEASDLYVKTNGLPSVILAKGPSGSPIMKLLEAFGTKAQQAYPAINVLKDGYFSAPNGNIYQFNELQIEIRDIVNELNTILYSEDYNSLGFNKILALLGDEVSKINAVVDNLNNALVVLQDNYKSSSLVFQSESSSIQKSITEARNQYIIAKDTYDHLVSDKEIMTAKRNAVDSKILEIAIAISDLITAKNALSSTIVSIDTQIAGYQTEINKLNTSIQADQDGIDTSTSNIEVSMNNILVSLNNAKTLQTGSFNYLLPYWGIMNVSSAVDFNDTQKDLPRLLNCLNNIYTLIGSSITTEAILKTDKKNYEDTLATYTNDVLAGTLTYAQQLIKLDEIAVLKTKYEDTLATYTGILNSLAIAREIKDLLLSSFMFIETRAWGELFTSVTLNTDPNSPYGKSNLTEFTFKLSKPLTEAIDVEFIYKEDTLGNVIITVPAGQTSGSVSMYLQNISDTNVDAGIPKWIAYKQGTRTEYNLFNLNKFNQMLMDDAVVFNSGDINARNTPILYTLDKTRFISNPTTTQKPLQSGSLLKTNAELYQIVTTTRTCIDNLSSRDQNILSLESFKNLLIQDQNLLIYNQNCLDAVINQKSMGQTTSDSYQLQIDYLTSRKEWFKSTTDIITEADLIGSDLSYDVCDAKIQETSTQIIAIESTLAAKKLAYENALGTLQTATDQALGKFIDGIAETNNLIKIKQDQELRVKVLFSLYSERVNLLNNIFKNLTSILESGIFSGEWITTDTFLLNRFEYQDAMEHLLVQIIDDVVKLPIASVITPKVLTYEIGSNGLQYPNDLQPWIFTKTSGKISTKRYPGATSIGTALNQNTLLLNIQHRPAGDISEFLNVYGNENDFNDQLISKYKSSQNNAIGIGISGSLQTITNKISDLNVLLANTPRTIQKTINGKLTNITTNLTNDEIIMIDNFISNLVVGSENSAQETQLAVNKKELLLRLVYCKFYGMSLTQNNFNSFEYLFGSVSSKSSWFDPIGNTTLLNDKDPFNPAETGGKNFKDYTKYLYDAIGGMSLNLSTLKDLFQNKLSLYKDLDIINYILMLLPEPTIDYNAKLLQLKANYKLILQYKLTNSRYILSDDPVNSNDDFENFNLTDEEIKAKEDATKAIFQTKITTNNALLSNEINKVNTSKISHDSIVERIARYDVYKTFYQSLKLDIQNAINLLNSKLSIYSQMKVEFSTQLKNINTEYLSYYNKMNKLPNVMWDIFRITNSQRTKWNYTYMVLRILGMQKELNDVVNGKNIQYSPINAEITELTIKKNAALTAGDQTAAYAYDLEITALKQKKTNFYNILSNIINEFNTIQQKYAKPTITPEVTLTNDKIISELYMQNPEEYNLSYNFAPYPMYKEI